MARTRDGAGRRQFRGRSAEVAAHRIDGGAPVAAVATAFDHSPTTTSPMREHSCSRRTWRIPRSSNALVTRTAPVLNARHPGCEPAR